MQEVKDETKDKSSKGDDIHRMLRGDWGIGPMVKKKSEKKKIKKEKEKNRQKNGGGVEELGA